MKRAHALNILVYPWFTVVRREDNAHPESAEAGTPQNAYDVHQPGFRTFAAQLILDVVARYDIDGVNLTILELWACACPNSAKLNTESGMVSSYLRTTRTLHRIVRRGYAFRTGRTLRLARLCAISRGVRVR